MVDLKLYIDNEKPLYNKKIEAYKKLWADYKKKRFVNVEYAKKILMPLVNETAKFCEKKYSEKASENDKQQAIKELIHEFEVEQIELKNYWSK